MMVGEDGGQGGGRVNSKNLEPSSGIAGAKCVQPQMKSQVIAGAGGGGEQCWDTV